MALAQLTVQLRIGPFDEPELSREAERCPAGFTPVVDQESGVLWFLNDRHLGRMMQTGRYVLVKRPAA